MDTWEDIIEAISNISSDSVPKGLLPEHCKYDLDGKTILIDKIISSFPFECPSVRDYTIKTMYPSIFYIGPIKSSNSKYSNYTNSGIYSKKNVSVITKNYNSEFLPRGVNLIIDSNACFNTNLELTTLMAYDCTVSGNATIKCVRAVFLYGIYPTNVDFIGLKMLRLCYMASGSYNKGAVRNRHPIKEVELYNCGAHLDLLDDIIDIGVEKITIINASDVDFCAHANSAYFKDSNLKFSESTYKGTKILMYQSNDD